MLETLSHHWKEWMMRRRTADALHRLNRHLLADIGVPEDRIEEFADPRRRAAAIAATGGNDSQRPERWVIQRPRRSTAGAREGNPVLVENV